MTQSYRRWSSDVVAPISLFNGPRLDDSHMLVKLVISDLNFNVTQESGTAPF